MSRDLRYYWARFDQLLIENGILGIRVPLGDVPTTQFRAIVPYEAKQTKYLDRSQLSCRRSLWSTENSR